MFLKTEDLTKTYQTKGKEAIDALKNVAGRFHELTGNRAGQWACDLDHPYRLIFKPVLNSDGNIVGLIVEQTVSILEIVNYHD